MPDEQKGDRDATHARPKSQALLSLYCDVFSAANAGDHPAAAVIAPLLKRLIRRLGCIAWFIEPAASRRYHHRTAFTVPLARQGLEHCRHGALCGSLTSSVNQ
jgi:hypothetical protein